MSIIVVEGSMKKSLLVATVLAVSSVAGSAYALDADEVRSLQVDGIGRSLGFIYTSMPLGWDGPFCDYLTNWVSPFNPNDVSTCLLHELRTPLAPSCIVNERFDFVTIVQSDAAFCAGFNLKGEYLPVTLLLSETSIGLAGVATFGCVGIPQVYPVITC
jgi:hypothetical protein